MINTCYNIRWSSLTSKKIPSKINLGFTMSKSFKNGKTIPQTAAISNSPTSKTLTLDKAIEFPAESLTS